MSKRFEYENLTNGILRVPVHKRVANKGKVGTTRRARDRSASIVFGAAMDRTLPPGTVRGPRCPSPVVVVTEEQLSALEPQARAFIESCVKQNWLRCREIAA